MVWWVRASRLVPDDLPSCTQVDLAIEQILALTGLAEVIEYRTARSPGDLVTVLRLLQTDVPTERGLHDASVLVSCVRVGVGHLRARAESRLTARSSVLC